MLKTIKVFPCQDNYRYTYYIDDDTRGEIQVCLDLGGVYPNSYGALFEAIRRAYPNHRDFFASAAAYALRVSVDMKAVRAVFHLYYHLPPELLPCFENYLSKIAYSHIHPKPKE